MKKYYADTKSLNILRVITFILLIVITIGLKYLLYRLQLMYPDYFNVEKNTVTEIIIWVLIGLVIAVYVLFILIFLPLWYNSVKYYVSDTDLISVSGVFFKNTQYMKLSAIQYVTTISAPLSKYTSFNFLVMSAHGGRMMFMFLSQLDLNEISDFILRDIKKRSEDPENKDEKAAADGE